MMIRPPDVEECISNLETCCDDDDLICLLDYIYACEQKIKALEVGV